MDHPQEERKRRPPSAYVIFAKEELEKIKRENPAISFGNACRIIHPIWEGLSETEKAVFYKRANDLKHA